MILAVRVAMSAAELGLMVGGALGVGLVAGILLAWRR